MRFGKLHEALVLSAAPLHRGLHSLARSRDARPHRKKLKIHAIDESICGQMQFESKYSAPRVNAYRTTVNDKCKGTTRRDGSRWVRKCGMGMR